MKKIILILVSIIFFTFNINAEDFSLFGLKIGDPLTDNLNPEYWYQIVGTDIDGFGITPPIKNDLIDTYNVQVNSSDNMINNIGASSIMLSNEMQCLKIRNVFEDAIKKTNKKNRKDFFEITIQHPSENSREIKYKHKEDESIIYKFILTCNKSDDLEKIIYYRLNIQLEKTYTVIDLLEAIMKDTDKIDTSGL